MLGNGSGNALLINAGSGSSLSGQDVNFNSTVNSGAITMLGGNGSINANNGNGIVTFNGGSNSVTVNTGSINGEVIGGGASNLIGSSFSLTSQSGTIVLGAITSPGAITVINNDNTGNGIDGRIYVNGAISSTGNTVSITSGNQAAILTNSSLINGYSGVSLTTPSLTNFG